MEISGLQLLHQWRNDGKCQEDRKQPGLHVDIAVSKVPEGERVEEPGDNVQHEFALHSCQKVSITQSNATYHGVLWSSPVRNKCPSRDSFNLRPLGGCKFAVLLVFRRIPLPSPSPFDVVDLV